MAAPTTYRASAAEAGCTTLCIQFAVGATGAVGAIQGGGKRAKEFKAGTPVVRTGTGVYDIFLKQSWLALLGHDSECFGAVASTAGWKGKVTTNNVASTSAPKVTVTFLRQDTGVAADPSNGDIASVTLFLKALRPD